MGHAAALTSPLVPACQGPISWPASRCDRTVKERRISGLRSEGFGYRDSEAPVLAELLRNCAGGDRGAFRRLYDMRSGLMLGIAMRITGQAALAADAVHDAFLQVWQQAGRFDPARGNPDAWLISLVRYRALDIRRRRAREVAGYEAPEEQADESEDALSRLTASADAAALRACLGTLEEDRRKLILLAFVDGLSHSDLAARLGQPLGTVKSWIRRALGALKRCLEP